MHHEQRRYKVNGVQIGIKLWPNKNNFCLMTSEDDNNYKIDVMDAKLNMKTY